MEGWSRRGYRKGAVSKQEKRIVLFVNVQLTDLSICSRLQAVEFKGSGSLACKPGAKGALCLRGSPRPLRPSALLRPEEFDSSVPGKEGRKEGRSLTKHTSGIGVLPQKLSQSLFTLSVGF